MSRDPVYGQLENTIANWTEEVTQAHNQLTSQIAEARDQLDTLSTIMARRQGESSALAKSREDIARLKDAVRKRDAELQQVQLERETLARRNALAEQHKLQAEERIAALRKEKEHLDLSLGESRSGTREALARVSTLEIELATCRGTIQEQQRDAEGDKARIEALNDRVAHLQQELTELTHRAMASEQTSSGLTERLHAAENDSQETRHTLAQKQDELRSLGEVLAERDHHLEIARQQLLENQNQIGSLQTEIQQISENRDLLAAEAGLLHEEKESLEGRIAHMAQQAWDIRRENEQLISTLAGLREALANSSRLLDETTHAFEELQEAHARLQDNLDQCQAELEEASRCAQQREEDYLQLQDAHEQVQSALTSYRETLEKLKQERVGLTGELESSRRTIDSLTTENIQLNERRVALEYALQNNSESLQLATERYDVTVQALSDARTQLSDTEARLDALRIREHDLTTRLEVSVHQLAERDASASELRRSLEESQGAVRNAEQEIAGLRENLLSTGAASEALQRRIEELTIELDTLRLERDESEQTLRTSLGARDAAISGLELELASVRGSLMTTSEDRALLKGQVAELQVQVDNDRNTLAELRHALSETKAALVEQGSENAFLARTLEETHQSNAALHDALRSTEERERLLATNLTSQREERDVIEHALTEACATLDLRQLELARLAEDQDALQQRHDLIVGERDQLTGTVIALEQKQHELEQDLRLRLAALETLEADLEGSRQRHTHLEELLSQERIAHAADLTAAREEQQALLRAIDEEQTVTSQLQAVIRDHESAASAAERRINQAESSICALTTQAREIQAQFGEELRQARIRHEETEALLQQREHELAQRTASVKQREGELDAANRTLSRLEQNLAVQREQFESVRTGLECDIDAANNRVRATEAALQGTRAENSALTNVLKEKEEQIGRDQRARQQLESSQRTLSQDLDTARKRVTIMEAENESLCTQLENATVREKDTARELSLAQATIRALQETIQQKENAVQQEKIRTAQLLHQTVSALQSELTQINTADTQRTPSSKWMSALNLDGRLLVDDHQRELPFSGEEASTSSAHGNGNGAHNGAGHTVK